MNIDLELVRLNLVEGLTPRAAAVLLERFGSAAAALAAPAGALGGLPGVGPKLAGRIAGAPTEADARQEIRRAARKGIGLLPRERFPEPLLAIPDPPLLLYVRGEIPPDTPRIAVVGARRASVYGRRQAERFGADLARAGAVVVSGLARGVDGAAHRGAVEAGGVSGAVLGCGLDRIYPPEHRDLAARLAETGFLLSELPLGRPPLAHHFPMRNRIIAGLSRSVVVVEGKIRSGSLITARLAADFGRNVFAVPGRVDSDLARGPHHLVREGAILVEHPGQVLEDSGLVPLAPEEPPPPPGDPVQARILGVLDPSDPRGVDEILESTELTAPAALAALLELELSGRVKVLAGRRYVRV